MFYRAPQMLVYVAAFWAITHAFILLYEERVLRRLFGSEYDDYRRQVRRWLPRL
jgi:protein-S-isoprenylcysteine O-methyltransferase Ste14